MLDMYSRHLFICAILFQSPIAFVGAQDPRTVQYNRDGQPDDPGLANYISVSLIRHHNALEYNLLTFYTRDLIFGRPNGI